MCWFIGGNHVSLRKYEIQVQNKAKTNIVILKLSAGSYLADKQALKLLCVLFRAGFVESRKIMNIKHMCAWTHVDRSLFEFQSKTVLHLLSRQSVVHILYYLSGMLFAWWQRRVKCYWENLSNISTMCCPWWSVIT